MATSREKIVEQLTTAGITFDPNAAVADLRALLPADVAAADDAADAADAAVVPAPTAAPSSGYDGIDVGDPQVLRPTELPLVIKPSNGGEWKNDAQAEYARNLNGYAYKNPVKWAAKKATLLAHLVEIGTDPSKLALYNGNADEQSGLKFKNNLLGG